MASTDRVPRHVVAAIAVSVALLVLNAVLLVINTSAVIDSTVEYSRSYDLRRVLDSLHASMTAAESGQRGYLLTGQNAYLEPYTVASRQWRTHIGRLRALTGDKNGRAEQIDRLEALATEAFARLEQTIRSSPAPGQFGQADLAGTGQASAAMDRVRSQLDGMVREEFGRVDSLRGEVMRDLLVAVGVALFTTVVSAAMLLGLHRLLQRAWRERESADRALVAANERLNLLVEERTAELAELSQHLIRVSEEEKAQLARELHDMLGSNLTAINMDLNWSLRRLPDAPREVRERLQRVLQMLNDTVELKHQVIEGLRPSHLDNLGLAFAMRSHCRDFSRRTGLPCDVDVAEDFDDLDPSWSIALYRIAQETLTNITKHAQASRVHLALNREPEGVRLRIVDDGVGLAEEALAKPKSHGVVGMRERMRQLGGQFLIRRADSGRGTVVEAFIPMSAPGKPRAAEHAQDASTQVLGGERAAANGSSEGSGHRPHPDAARPSTA